MDDSAALGAAAALILQRAAGTVMANGRQERKTLPAT